MTSTFVAGTPSSSNSYQPASRVPFSVCRVGSSVTERNSGKTSLVQFLGKGLALFVAALPLAFQSVSQHLMEKHPEARPESSAGPS